MEYIIIPLIIIAVLVAATLIIAYICFKMAFYQADRITDDSNDFVFPEGEIYGIYLDKIKKWTVETRQMPHEDFEITSFDGLKLCGKYYEYSKDAPIEIMFHGYRGTAERDLSGGVQRCFTLGHSALIVEQRASGKSDGNVISFGINEHRDAICWARFAAKHFDKERKFILTGISMGAATVLMTADKDLPENVIGILADCGYTSAKEIIKLVIKGMKLPPNLAYPFVKLGARIYGHFNLEGDSPIKAVKNAKIPIIYFHGKADTFVPCYMSEKNYEATSTRKYILTVDDAGHGLAYPSNPQEYLKAVDNFFHK